MTRNARVRQCLREGPATTVELADSLLLPRVRIHKAIRILRELGHIRATGYALKGAWRGPRLKLYEITAKGMRAKATKAAAITRNARVRLFLREGPATTVELAGSLHLPRVAVHATIHILRKLGHVRAAGPTFKGARTGPRLKLYEITIKGQRKDRNRVRKRRQKARV